MERKYYEAYEDRYRQVYHQGVKYWSGLPWEIAEDLAGVEAFLEYAGADPSRHSVLEPGCGEGHLAVFLAGKGYRYMGVDLAPSAVEKACARAREAGLDDRARFIMRDATDLSFLPPGTFDLALDNKFLHMLVVDRDRERYLTGLRSALKAGAHVMFSELYRQGAYDGPVPSFERYVEVFQPDLATLEERTAYNGAEEVTVRIPRVPARPKDEAGYAIEMRRSGFAMERFEVLSSYMGCRFFARAI